MIAILCWYPQIITNIFNKIIVKKTIKLFNDKVKCFIYRSKKQKTKIMYHMVIWNERVKCWGYGVCIFYDHCMDSNFISEEEYISQYFDIIVLKYLASYAS